MEKKQLLKEKGKRLEEFALTHKILVAHTNWENSEFFFSWKNRHEPINKNANLFGTKTNPIDYSLPDWAYSKTKRDLNWNNSIKGDINEKQIIAQSPYKKPSGRPVSVKALQSLGIKYKPYKEEAPWPLRDKWKVPSPIK